MDASGRTDVLRTYLEKLSRGILSELPDVAELPTEEAHLGELLTALKDRWAKERRETIEQAVSALNQSTRLYHRERERAEELEAAHRELKQTQAQLVHASKLASLGTLAAGVAHEINQPLTVIMSLAELMGLRADDRVGEHADHLRQMDRAAERIGRIVDNVRTFGRQNSFKLEPTRLVEPLERALELFEARLGVEGIRLERDYELPEHLESELDPSRMEQVFVNLLANARDALRGKCVDAAAPTIRLRAAKEDDVVRYVVEDNGPGVPRAEVEHIFDPFFTTKEVGEGTGLGLSLSHSIVKEHGGELEYERDEPWTRLVVTLPFRPPSIGAQEDAATGTR